MNALATLAAAAVFVLIFYGESWWQWPMPGQRGSRRFVSFSAGIAVAYVFVYLLPELASASDRYFSISDGRGLPFGELRIYVAGLAGFMVFYGLEYMVRWARFPDRQRGPAAEADSVRFHVLAGSYVFYILIVCYLMANELRVGEGRLALYTLAMGLHFLGIAYGLRRDGPSVYNSWGRHALSLGAVCGWAVAILFPLPESAAYMLLGFVGGALIMNTVTSELPGRAEGSLYAFLAGGLLGGALYAIVLLLAR